MKERPKARGGQRIALGIGEPQGRAPGRGAYGAVSRHLRSNVYGLVAIFIALGGTAYATHPGGENTISTEDIIDGEVRQADLRQGAVSRRELQNGAVVRNKINGGAVNTGKLANGAVTEEKIGPGQVGADQLDDFGVTTDKIDFGAVTEPKIADGGVTASKLGTLTQRTSGTAVFVAPGTVEAVVAECDEHEVAISGGANWTSTSNPEIAVQASFPSGFEPGSTNPTSWSSRGAASADAGASASFQGYVLCLAATTAVKVPGEGG